MLMVAKLTRLTHKIAI